MEEVEVLRRQLERARREVSALEQLVEENARTLYTAQEDQRQTATFLMRVLGTMSSAVFVADSEGIFTSVNPSACELLHCWEDELVGKPATGVFCDGEQCPDPGQDSENIERNITRPGGGKVPVLFSSTPLFGDDGKLQSTVYVAADLTHQKKLEVQLRHSQKLESVGQLAAGVAHEINTPIQFVGDSLVFLEEAFVDLSKSIDAGRAVAGAARSAGDVVAAAAAFEAVADEVDIEFLVEEIPTAIARALDGIARVSRIVRAMKSFAHPGQVELAPADLDSAIDTTLIVARNEYRYVADVVTHFGGLPSVYCNIGDINQVVLNLIVNAAHAIEGKVGSSGERGTITVETEVRGEHALIRVSDTGTGIPAAARGRVFDPFFTTKDVGKGTGQGLSLAHNIIVERHGGSITFETVDDEGTTFEIALPLGRAEVKHAA
ncbi:MAG: ATP-binding protein [Planctomycetota bacterium]